jgi:ABC-type multidrug transport system fused ATPase/permease subunit
LVLYISKQQIKGCVNIIQYRRFIIPNIKYFLCGFLLIILNSLLTIYSTDYIKRLAASIINQSNIHIKNIVATIFVIVIAGMMFTYLSKLFSGTFAVKVATAVRNELVTKIIDMRYDYMHKRNIGEIFSRLIDDVNDLQNFLQIVLCDFLMNLIILISVFAYMFYMNWVLALISSVWLPVIFVATQKVSARINKLTQERKIKTEIFLAIAQEAFEGVEIEKSYGLQNIINSKANCAIDNIFKLDIEQQKKLATINPISFSLRLLPILGLCVIAAYTSFLGNMPSENFVAFTILFGIIAQPLNELPNNFINIRQSFVSITRMNEILATPSEISGEMTDKQEHDVIIKFNNLRFSYENNNPCIDGISFKIKKEDKVAIVGASGSGKSTIIKILLGLYPEYDGGYDLYGIPFKEWDLSVARSFFATMLQDSFVFSESIKENISYGCINATMSEITEAAKLAHIHDYIESLPNKYHTILGEESSLSGGQKQKLSLARALLKNAPIFLLDEPTSSLDVESELEVQAVLDKFCANKTVITIAHRLSTIEKSDVILVMSGGKIIDSGKHIELLNRCNVYSNLYMSQFVEEKSNEK